MAPPSGRLTLVLGAALALSLAAHALRGESTPREVPPGNESAQPALGRDDADAEVCDGCERELAACSEASRKIAADAFRRGEKRAPRGRAAGPAKAAGRVEQAEALCAKAQQSLRESWARDRASIAEGLRKTLPDEREQARALGEKLEEMRGVVDVDDEAFARLSRDYADRRRARVEAAAAAVDGDPPDFEAVLEEAQALFDDEDALVRRTGGDEALASWREDQLDGRTVILALLASMADLPWDEETIGW